MVGDSDSILAPYFGDIDGTGSNPLSREREVELSERIKEGDVEARDELVQANLRYVITVAKNYQYRGLPLADLISSGNLGLMTASERFDGARGYKFISYAVWWIRQSILQTLADHGRTVRLPMNKVALLWNIAKVTHRLGEELEGRVDAEAVARELNLPAQEIEEILLQAGAVGSLDDALDDDGDRSLLDVLADADQEQPDAMLLRASAREKLEHVMAGLDEREHEILCRYFGLDGEGGCTLEVIGERMGVTRERIRQIKEVALAKLRHPSHYQALKGLLPAE